MQDRNARHLFLIPARGGSKGLPGKNLAEVGGIPLVGRAARLGCRALTELGAPGRVICSTDDHVVAEAAQRWGAEVPFLRPAELATDGARSLDVVIHALDVLREDFDAVVLLQPTSPLTEVEDILGALELFYRTGSPVVSVCQAEHPVEWHHHLDGTGRLTAVIPARDTHQRQGPPVSHRFNGAVYVASPAQVRDGGFWTPATHGFVMPAGRSADVDTAADLDLARALVAARNAPSVALAGRMVGQGYPCFIVAEAGVNHNGSLAMARRLVDAAADAGADAVKFQTFRAERVVTPDAPKAAYQVRATGDQESQLEMLRRLELDEEAHRDLMECCRQRGIRFLSTPFDEGSLDLLSSLGLPAIKLSSGELTNLPFLRGAARKGKPLILSTGMANLEEVAKAVDAIRAEGGRDLVLLHCVSNYPADPADANLRAMTTLREAFCTPVGFSDHTEGDAIALAAVAMGASLLEKHFTLDRGLPGPDHQASIEPSALKELVRRVRSVEAAMGHGRKEPAASEADTARVARRSLVAVQRIPAGTVLVRAMIDARRPGTGLPPDQLDSVIGRTALSDIPEGTVLRRDLLT